MSLAALQRECDRLGKDGLWVEVTFVRISITKQMVRLLSEPFTRASYQQLMKLMPEMKEFIMPDASKEHVRLSKRARDEFARVLRAELVKQFSKMVGRVRYVGRVRVPEKHPFSLTVSGASMKEAAAALAKGLRS